MGDYSQYINGEWRKLSTELPEEMQLAVFVNGQELVTILCTPERLNCLLLGFLRAEGFINGLDDIALMRVCDDESLADVRLKRQDISMPTKRVLTSGCGGGTSFQPGTGLPPVKSASCFSPAQIISAIRMLQQKPEGEDVKGIMHRGVHVSALSDGEQLLVRSEDIGRHNTLDKIWGECMLRKIPTADKMLVTTGRISSEMLVKAAKMEVPVVASLNSATERAVQLGAELGITVVGYVRGSRLFVFTGEERVMPADVRAGG
ncbi:MAG: formate dehydrogenase accessory sulfurtransferase FdhD [Chloroflexi bacterium]|nr:formate dehydrogenase accessory sulfurtransferase FdhD [Chloroflexota bacterium]